jgi:hypothetical protein
MQQEPGKRHAHPGFRDAEAREGEREYSDLPIYFRGCSRHRGKNTILLERRILPSHASDTVSRMASRQESLSFAVGFGDNPHPGRPTEPTPYNPEGVTTFDRKKLCLRMLRPSPTTQFLGSRGKGTLATFFPRKRRFSHGQTGYGEFFPSLAPDSVDSTF